MVKTKSMCVDCIQLEGKDKKHAKCKAAELATPAKLNAHVKVINGQNELILTQNKEIKGEFSKFKHEIVKRVEPSVSPDSC